MISIHQAIPVLRIRPPADATLRAAILPKIVMRASSVQESSNSEKENKSSATSGEDHEPQTGTPNQSSLLDRIFQGLSSKSEKSYRFALRNPSSSGVSVDQVEAGIYEFLTHDFTGANLSRALEILEKKGVKSERIEQLLLIKLSSQFARRISWSLKRAGFMLQADGTLLPNTELMIRALVPRLSQTVRNHIFRAILKTAPDYLDKETLELATRYLKQEHGYSLEAALILARHAELTPATARILAELTVNPPTWLSRQVSYDKKYVNPFADDLFAALRYLEAPFPSTGLRAALVACLNDRKSVNYKIYRSHLTPLAGLVLRSVISGDARDGFSAWLFNRLDSGSNKPRAPVDHLRVESTIEVLRERLSPQTPNEDYISIATMVCELFNRVYPSDASGDYYRVLRANQILLAISLGERVDLVIESILKEQVERHPDGDYSARKIFQHVNENMRSSIWRAELIAALEIVAANPVGSAGWNLRRPAIAALAALKSQPSSSLSRRVSQMCAENDPELQELETCQAQSILFFKKTEDIYIAKWIARMALRLPPSQLSELLRIAKDRVTLTVQKELVPIAEFSTFSEEPSLLTASLEFLRTTNSVEEK